MDFRRLSLESMPPRTQLLLLGVVAAGLVGAFYMYVMKAPLEEIVTLRAEVSQLEISVAQGTAIAMQLGKFKKELAELEQRLNVLRGILPAQKETPSVLRSVQQMAAASDLKIVKFSPQQVIPRVFYSDWPIAMEVLGSYDGLGLFFEKIGQSTRIINVDNISIRGIEGSNNPTRTLRATCTATTFVFREEVVTGSKN